MAGQKKLSLKAKIIATLVILTIIAMSSYLLVRATLFITADYLWYEKIVAFLLLCAESFLLVHGLGYFFDVLHVLTQPAATGGIAGPIPPLKSYPPVAIIVSEETGIISIAHNGVLTRYLDEKRLRSILTELCAPPRGEGISFWPWRNSK